ncbi:uncharacterized protein MYCFIDRAFT_180356 [Pseudocercospora fijiensis CIRAD86]|uniref:Uncharacterized protein n=1 Tax=Pseudocercospora fijiensis (strain CIRAD86) TaxID=383855 RepID=M2YGT7_PSEFD|nr:uncharacterized protein MYCFIDRAFT_180356 [Pseudocercospora fijiensis CIRAD86]EME77025.1 hypothetical protein MYCFIDRAFT_180356 [Pseudocercospora fijiensis CIRAD86]
MDVPLHRGRFDWAGMGNEVLNRLLWRGGAVDVASTSNGREDGMDGLRMGPWPDAVYVWWRACQVVGVAVVLDLRICAGRRAGAEMSQQHQPRAESEDLPEMERWMKSHPPQASAAARRARTHARTHTHKPRGQLLAFILPRLASPTTVVKSHLEHHSSKANDQLQVEKCQRRIELNNKTIEDEERKETCHAHYEFPAQTEVAVCKCKGAEVSKQSTDPEPSDCLILAALLARVNNAARNAEHNPIQELKKKMRMGKNHRKPIIRSRPHSTQLCWMKQGASAPSVTARLRKTKTKNGRSSKTPPEAWDGGRSHHLGKSHRPTIVVATRFGADGGDQNQWLRQGLHSSDADSNCESSREEVGQDGVSTTNIAISTDSINEPIYHSNSLIGNALVEAAAINHLCHSSETDTLSFSFLFSVASSVSRAGCAAPSFEGSTETGPCLNAPVQDLLARLHVAVSGASQSAFLSFHILRLRRANRSHAVSRSSSTWTFENDPSNSSKPRRRPDAAASRPSPYFLALRHAHTSTCPYPSAPTLFAISWNEPLAPDTVPCAGPGDDERSYFRKPRLIRTRPSTCTRIRIRAIYHQSCLFLAPDTTPWARRSEKHLVGKISFTKPDEMDIVILGIHEEACVGDRKGSCVFLLFLLLMMSLLLSITPHSLALSCSLSRHSSVLRPSFIVRIFTLVPSLVKAILSPILTHRVSHGMGRTSKQRLEGNPNPPSFLTFREEAMMMHLDDGDQPLPTPMSPPMLLRQSNQEQPIPPSSTTKLHLMNDRPWLLPNYDSLSPASIPPVPRHLILPSHTHGGLSAAAPHQLFDPKDLFDLRTNPDEEMELEEVAALFGLDRAGMISTNTPSTPNDIDMISTHPSSTPNNIDTISSNPSFTPSITSGPGLIHSHVNITSTPSQILVARGDPRASRSSRRLNWRLRNAQQNGELLLSEATSSPLSCSSSGNTHVRMPPRTPTTRPWRIDKSWNNRSCLRNGVKLRWAESKFQEESPRNEDFVSFSLEQNQPRRIMSVVCVMLTSQINRHPPSAKWTSSLPSTEILLAKSLASVGSTDVHTPAHTLTNELIFAGSCS